MKRYADIWPAFFTLLARHAGVHIFKLLCCYEAYFSVDGLALKLGEAFL